MLAVETQNVYSHPRKRSHILVSVAAWEKRKKKKEKEKTTITEELITSSRKTVSSVTNLAPFFDIAGKFKLRFLLYTLCLREREKEEGWKW